MNALNPNNQEDNTTKNTDPDIFSRFFAVVTMNNNDDVDDMDNPDTDPDENN